METFRAVALTACLLGIVTAVFSALYPSEKFSKEMKTIFSLILVLCLVKPIAGGKISLPDISGTVSASNEYYSGLRDNADEYFIRSVESNISASVTAALGEIEVYPEEVETSINISEDWRIFISEVKITLNGPADESAVRERVAEQVGSDAAVTIIIPAGKEDGYG